MRKATTLRRCVFAVAVATALVQPIWICDAQSTPQVQDDVVQLDPAHTSIDFTLLGNLHTTHGRFTLKSGTIRKDPGTANATGEIAITTASEDSSEHLRDAIIQNAVLDIEHYPEIIFTPQRIQGIRDSQGNFYGQITGLMQLHGGLHQITVQIQGRLFADEITADCNFLVPYAERSRKPQRAFANRDHQFNPRIRNGTCLRNVFDFRLHAASAPPYSAPLIPRF
jgi:polyisoprenoid-binding protein YceI